MESSSVPQRPPQVPTSRKIAVRFSSSSKYQPFSYLPELLLQLILSYLSPVELGRISAVDRQMNRETSIVAEFCARKILREVFSSDYSTVLQRLLVSQPSISYKKFLNDLRKRRVLVLNGTSKHSTMFDINTNKWTPCSVAMTQHRAAFSSVWFRGELVVISGNVPDVATGTVEKYNPFTDTWTSLPCLPQRLRYAAGAVLHNQLYVIGGFNKTSGVRSNAVYRYENNEHIGDGGVAIGGGYWNLLDIALPSGRYTHAAVGFDGKLWVAGGFPKPDSVEIYDPALGDWSAAPPMSVRRAQFKLLVVNGELYAVGGDDAMTNKTTIEKFDRRLQAWSIVATLKEQRLMLSSSVAGSKIYVFGGMVSSTKALETWDAFDVRTNAWDSDDHTVHNEVDHPFEDEDDGYLVGYDLDDDVDVDMEMAIDRSPRDKASPDDKLYVAGGGYRCSPAQVNMTPVQSTKQASASLRLPYTPMSCGASYTSSAAVGMTSSEELTPSPPSDGLRRCSSNGQIALSVPSSIKRSLSGTFVGYSSTTPSRQVSGSFQHPSPSPNGDSSLALLVSPPPLRINFSPVVTVEDVVEPSLVPRSARRAKRRKRVAQIDRKMPFAHAFGCAITIPAICLYSSM